MLKSYNLMKTLVYDSPFIPPEWIAAHGWRSKKIIPSIKIKAPNLQIDSLEGLCPYARAWLSTAVADSDSDALVMTTSCDQMRRLAEVATERLSLPVFLMHIPRTWQTNESLSYYKKELMRLGDFLVKLGGVKANEKLEIDKTECSHKTYSNNQGIPLALIGSPILRELIALFDKIRKLGFQIFDTTRNGIISHTIALELSKWETLSFDELANIYFNNIPDAFRRPNTLLYSWLKEQIIIHDIKGIIFHRQVWCDLWAAETERIRGICGLPTVVIESGGDDETPLRMHTQIETFLERLRR